MSEHHEDLVPAVSKNLPVSRFDRELVPHQVSTILSLDRLREIRDSDMSWLDKKRMIRQEVRANIDHRQAEINASLDVERKKLAVQVDVAVHQLAWYRERLLTEIQKNFTEFVASMGREVAGSERQFLTDFAEEVTKYEKDLQRRDINPQLKEKLLKRTFERFDGLYDKVGNIVADLTVPEDPHKAR